MACHVEAAAEGRGRGQAEVRHHQEAPALAGEPVHLAPRLGRAAGERDVDARRAQPVPDDAAHLGLVVHDEDRRSRGAELRDLLDLLEVLRLVRRGLRRGGGGREGGLDHRGGLATVLVELPREVQHELLGVDAEGQRLAGEVAVAEDARHRIAQVEGEVPLAQADQPLEDRRDAGGRRSPPPAGGPAAPGSSRCAGARRARGRGPGAGPAPAAGGPTEPLRLTASSSHAARRRASARGERAW